MSLKYRLNKIKFDVKKASPAIMLVTSTVLGAAAIVEFVRKTREALPVADEYKKTLDELTETHRITQDTNTYRKDVVTETAKAGVKLAKIYAKPIGLYALSLGLNYKSFSIMHNRNVALMAAYAGVGNEMRRVYSNIAEKYGDDALDEIKNGIKKVEVDETYINEETGKEETRKKVVSVVDGDPNAYSPYARFFDEASRAWRDDAEYNLWFLMEREADANRLLRTQESLLLNDVYDMLDIPRTQAGTRVGWKYYPHGENPCGDNKVSFGIHDIHRPAARDFVNGYEKVILLDFNVDGEVIDALPRI